MSGDPRAFTRIELLAMVAGIMFLAVAAGSALGTGRADSERAACWNNLRLIGRGVQTWAGDHDGQPPWWVPTSADRAPVGGGTGTPYQKPPAAWYEFWFLSEHLISPKILACPADQVVLPASDWVAFTSSNGRSKALSYNLNLHASAESPKTWLASDLNTTFDLSSVPCEARVLGTAGVFENGSSQLRWTNGLSHNDHGHVLLNDGSVEFTSTGRWRGLALNPDTDRIGNGTDHFLRAR